MDTYASRSFWTIIRCRSEMLFLSLSFCLLTDPVLQTFLLHCHMAHDDGGLWCNVFWKVCIRESGIDVDRINNDSIESLLVCELIYNVEWKDQKFIKFSFYIIVFGHDTYVSTCHGRNLYRTIKSGTLSNKFKNSLSNDISIIFQP